MDEQIHDTQESNEPQATPEERMEAFLSVEDSKEQPTAEASAEVEVADEEEEVDEEVSAEADEVSEDEDLVEDTESEDSDEEQAEEEEVRYTVKAHGEEKEVTVDELIKSYQLGTDYTKKTQELAEQRKQLEEDAKEIAEVVKMREYYAQGLDQLEHLLKQDKDNVDLDKLRENDPVSYAVRVAEQTEMNKKLHAIQVEKQKLAEQQQAEHQKYMQKHIQAESVKLTELIPEFSQKDKGEQIRKEIRNFGKQIGLPEEELNSVQSALHVYILNLARKQYALQQGKVKTTKKVSQAPKMVKSKAKMLDTKSQAYRNQRKALKETGDSNVAVSVFESILNS